MNIFRAMITNDREGEPIDWNGLQLMMASVDKITKKEKSVLVKCTFVFSRFFNMDEFENIHMGVPTERTIGPDFRSDSSILIDLR